MLLRDVRIRNFRSIENLNITIGETTVLFGKNDSGKSNVVKAIEFAFDRRRQVDISNVHVSSSNNEPKNTVVSVDVRLVGNSESDFQWLLSYGEKSFNINDEGEISLAFRTEATYHPETRSFDKSRHIINEWKSEELGEILPAGLLDSIDFIFLDAHRDIAEVVRDRYSRWNQEVRKADISDEVAREAQIKLKELGDSIVEASPFLTAAQIDLKGSTDRRATSVEIAPVARNLNELYRSLDVLVTEGAGPGMSISLFGSGTRSRAELMAYKSLVDIAEQDAEKEGVPYYCLAVFEEPEAHIHPQSQQQLFLELGELGTQRIVTTHSPYLLAKAPISSLVYVKRENHSTTLNALDVDLTEDQKKATERFLLRTHGEILFANAVIFVEGETEAQALPIFYERRYGRKPFELGITIVACEGSNYSHFIRITNKLGIPWLIFSDAEEKTLKKVESQLRNALGREDVNITEFSQVVRCSLGNDYEAELINDGYSREMIDAIDVYDGRQLDPKEKRETTFRSWKHNTNKQRAKGGGLYDFDGPEGEVRALVAYLDIKENKTRYATPIAEAIASLNDDERAIPSCLRSLFNELDRVLCIAEGEDYD